jgi:hypothetical protein
MVTDLVTDPTTRLGRCLTVQWTWIVQSSSPSRALRRRTPHLHGNARENGPQALLLSHALPHLRPVLTCHSLDVLPEHSRKWRRETDRESDEIVDRKHQRPLNQTVHEQTERTWINLRDASVGAYKVQTVGRDVPVQILQRREPRAGVAGSCRNRNTYNLFHVRRWLPVGLRHTTLLVHRRQLRQRVFSRRNRL